MTFSNDTSALNRDGEAFECLTGGQLEHRGGAALDESSLQGENAVPAARQAAEGEMAGAIRDGLWLWRGTVDERGSA